MLPSIRNLVSMLLFASLLLSMTPCHAARKDLMNALYAADFAEENSDEETKDFSMEGQLGVVMTTGNTRGASIDGRITADHETDDWRTNYILETLYTRSRRVDRDESANTTAQRINASIESDYKLLDPNKRIFLFADFEDNRFNVLGYQASIAAGWAEVMWDTPESTFRYSVGPGYNVSERDDEERNNLSGIIVRASAEYAYEWASGARLKQIISTWAGSGNTRSRSETSISARVIDKLAMKLSVRLDHNTAPSPGNATLDTETSVSLVYQFF